MKTLAVAMLLGLAQAEVTAEEQTLINEFENEEKELMEFQTDEQLDEEDNMWEMEEETELLNENLTQAQRAKYELQKREFNEAAQATYSWLQKAGKLHHKVQMKKKANFMHLKNRMKVWCKRRAIVKRDFKALAAQVRQNFHVQDLANNHKKAYLSNQHNISQALNKLKRADRKLKHTVKRDVKNYIKRDQRIN